MPDGVLRTALAPWLEVPTDKADQALMHGSSVWRGSNGSIDPGYGRFIKAMSALTTPHPIPRA